jgi:hypothetical protein
VSEVEKKKEKKRKRHTLAWRKREGVKERREEKEKK